MIKSAVSSSPTRRSFLATSATAGAFGLVVLAAAGCAQTVPAADADASAAKLRGAAEANVIRPFRINVPEEALVDLRRRVVATRWPDRETVTDQSQGVQLAKIQALVRYWGTGYDWRKVETKLNALPQFVTKIDGLDIHFIQVKFRHPNALPLLITHSWPGSVLELVKAIGPLTDPTHTVDARRTHSMSSSPRCPVTASRANRRPLAGIPIALGSRGTC